MHLNQIAMARVHILAVFSIVSFFTAAAADSGQSPRVAAWGAIDKGLHSGDLDHRRQTAVALSTIDASNQEAVRRLTETLKNDKSPRVRQQAALALGQMKARQAIPALKDALEDTTEVAFAAAKSLTDLGDPAGQGLLVAVLSGERKDTPGMMTNARREAEKRLKHPEGLLLMRAEDATGTMFGPAAMGIEAIKDAVELNGKGAPGRAAAAAYLAKDPEPYAVTLLEWALADDSSFVRVEAAKGLGQRGNAESVAKLMPLLEDSRNSVRTMAAASIIRLTP
jgi:HEAT repeat protein